jgi:hypothetical protein
MWATTLHSILGPKACSKCGDDNRIGAKFCDECATLAHPHELRTQLSPTANFARSAPIPRARKWANRPDGNALKCLHNAEQLAQALLKAQIFCANCASLTRARFFLAALVALLAAADI